MTVGSKAQELRRYHHKIHFPSNVADMCLEFLTQIKRIGVTHHAVAQMREDKRGEIPSPSRDDLLHPSNTVVEFYEIVNRSGNPTGKIQKMVIRCHHLNERFDYTYVLAREGFIVSSWANDKGDDHRLTSKRTMYYDPVKEKNG